MERGVEEDGEISVGNSALLAQRPAVHSCFLLTFAATVADLMWKIPGHSFCPFSVLLDTIENVDYEGLLPCLKNLFL